MRTFTDLTPAGARYFAQLAALTESQVKAGFPEGSGSYGEGQSLAQVAAWNDLGTIHIPARPFMERSFQNGAGTLREVCISAIESLAAGGDAQSALDRVGSAAAELIVKEIDGGGFGSNSLWTILAKGFNRPLIETGLLRSSVDYTVERGGSP